MNLGGVGLLPIFAIGAGAELFVFSKFTSIRIKCVAMKCSMAHRITRWVLFGIQCMEVGGVARLELAAGLRCHGDCGWWLKLGFHVVVCWDGGIIRVCCRWVHPQRCGRGSRDRWFHSSGDRQDWGAVNHAWRIGRGRGSRDRWVYNWGGMLERGVCSHPQRCSRSHCWLVGVGGAMQDEHKQLEGLGVTVTQGCQRRVWRGELEGVNNVSNASLDVIDGGGGWHWDLLGNQATVSVMHSDQVSLAHTV